MEFYKILSSIMEEKHLSIPQVAKMTGLSDSTVRSIITRKQNSVALEVAAKISKGLNVTYERLNGEEENHSLSLEEINHIKKYRALDERGKRMVDLVLEEEYEQSQKSVHILQAVARGGTFLEKELIDDQISDVDRLLEEIPPEYDENI